MVVLGARAWGCLPFIEDDAFISLRYARRLLDGHGLTWTDGRHVEGYSNFLWVMLNALLGGCGVDLVTSARGLGYLGMSAAIAAVVFASRPALVIECFPALVGALTIALAYPAAVWTIGGMEQPLVAALLAWAVVGLRPVLERREGGERRAILSGVCLGLLCLTRPDGALFTVGAALAVVLARGWSRDSIRRAAALAGLPIVCYAGQLAFRLAYYGEWLPNTALVKIMPSARHLADGWRYVSDGVLALNPLSFAALLFVVAGLLSKRQRRRVLPPATCGALWAGYVIFVGGDVFAAFRHGIPLIVLMAMVTVQAVEWWQQRIRQAAWHGVLLLVIGCLFAWFVDGQAYQARREAWLMEARWQWNGRVIGLMLKRGFAKEQPVIAVDAAGSLPYWSELPALDMLGLNDYYLPRHPPKNVGGGFLGHELGEGRYLLDQRPDLVFFRSAEGQADAFFLGGRQMQADPDFRRWYTLVVFEGRVPDVCRSRVWVRRDSEKIGIRRGATEIVVPAYLLNGESDTVAYLDAAGGFVVSATRRQPAVVRDLVVPPGRWRVQAAAAGPVEITMSISDGGSGGATGVPASGPAPEFSAPDEVRLDITVTPATDGPVEVRELRIVAAGQSP